MKPNNQQEQSSGGVPKIKFFEILCKILRKILVLESVFNEISGNKTCNFIDK